MTRINQISPSEITSQYTWRRRKFILQMSAGLGLALPHFVRSAGDNSKSLEKLKFIKNKAYSTTESTTKFRSATSYNNFYEFGTDKSDPIKYSKNLVTKPWSVNVHGEVLTPKRFDLDELTRIAPIEERIYRLRCVEGWSMVIPWMGFPLSKLLKLVKPTANAKYVEFTTLYRPSEMPGQKTSVLDWPYIEGLRIDEAVHPLTILGLGMYGSVLPNQNGAPVRVIVPWKYGFKSAKSIVSIKLTETQPKTTWMVASPKEYGFYSNVNPGVRHPRWSQAKERRIGEFRKRDTLIFNGYGEYVAELYSGLDLKKYF